MVLNTTREQLTKLVVVCCSLWRDGQAPRGQAANFLMSLAKVICSACRNLLPAWKRSHHGARPKTCPWSCPEVTWNWDWVRPELRSYYRDSPLAARADCRRTKTCSPCLMPLLAMRGCDAECGGKTVECNMCGAGLQVGAMHCVCVCVCVCVCFRL